ncbi:hypothetical protein CA11_19110 [Gimesia maris]|nr:hypothetical protein CA11_19110 [Gimesia maris]
MNRLKELFDEIKCWNVQFEKHDEILHDVLFDMITAESALIGIADQLLSNSTPSPDQLTILRKTLMIGDMWFLFDGGKHDLTVDEVLLRRAKMLVSLQQECQAYLKTPRD